jgi:hypothetical protein
MGKAEPVFRAGLCNFLSADLTHIFMIWSVADHGCKAIARCLGNVSHTDLWRGGEIWGDRAEGAHDFLL